MRVVWWVFIAVLLITAASAEINRFDLDLPPLVEESTLELVARSASVKSTTVEQTIPVIITVKDSEEIYPEYDDQKEQLDNYLRNFLINELNNQETHTFSSFNGFRIEVTQSQLSQLQNHPLVASVEIDEIMKTTLSDSTGIVGANQTWNVLVNNKNLTGEGQTVCIIDGGINYTHIDFGACSPGSQTIRDHEAVNSTSASYPSPYPTSQSGVVADTITKAGYKRIALHFRDINMKNGDYLCLINATDSTASICYTGTYTNFWSSSVIGDTVRLVYFTGSDSTGYRGYSVNDTRDGTVDPTYGLNWSSCPKILGAHDFVASDSDPMDAVDGHGTHVAGTVAGNGTITGVAPDAKLVIVRSMDDSGSGFTSDIVAGIEYCTDYASQWNISVISMSLGSSRLYDTTCDGSQASYAAAIDAATAQNISVVVAAGNDGEANNISSPACIANAIAIGSATKADAISGFSNRNGDMVDLFAPGSSIVATDAEGGSKTLSGTSMATPHVSAAFAIMYQAMGLIGDSKTPSQLETFFRQNGTSIADGSNGSNTYYRINLDKSIETLLIEPPIITVNSPQAITYNESSVIDFNVTLNEAGTVWFTLNSSNDNITLDTQDNLTFNFTNSSMDDATYIATFYATDQAGNMNSTAVTFTVSIPVDTTAPSLTINEPQQQWYTTNNITFNITANENSSATFVLNSSSDNISLLTDDNLTFYYTNESISDGNYTITFYANDTNNNFNTTSVSFGIDIINPSITLTANESLVSSSQSIVFTATVSDSNGILSVSLENQSMTRVNATAYTLTSTLASLGFSTSGLKSITANVSDVANNTNTSSVSITLDSQAPTFNSIVLSDSILQSNTPITININVTDNVNVQNVTVNNVGLTKQGDVWNGTITPSSSTLTIVATDNVSNQNTTTQNITFDNTLPSVVIDLQVANQQISSSSWQNETVTVTINASDANGINQTQYRFFNDTSWNEYSAPFNVTTNVSRNLIYARAIDQANNYALRKKSDLKIDPKSPSLSATITSNLVTPSFPVTVTVTATDQLSRLGSVWAYINDSSNTSLSFSLVSGKYVASLTSPSENGSYMVFISANDTAGNLNTTNLSLSVISGQPYVIPNVANGSFVSNNSQIRFNLSTTQLNYSTDGSITIVGASPVSTTQSVQSPNLTIYINVTNGVLTNRYQFVYFTDTSAPSLTTNIANDQVVNGTIRITASASDVQSDIQNISLYLDGEYISSLSTYYDLDTLLYNDSNYTLTFQAFNGVNLETNITRNIVVRNNIITTVSTTSNTALFDDTSVENYVDAITGLNSTNASITIFVNNLPNQTTPPSDLEDELIYFDINASTPDNATIYFSVPLSLVSGIGTLYVWSDHGNNGSYDGPYTVTSVENTSTTAKYYFTTNQFSGFVVGEQYSSCSEGAISSTCMCGGTPRSSGYCCSNSYQGSECTEEESSSSSSGGGGGGGGAGSASVTSASSDESSTSSSSSDNTVSSIAGEASNAVDVNYGSVKQVQIISSVDGEELNIDFIPLSSYVDLPVGTKELFSFNISNTSIVDQLVISLNNLSDSISLYVYNDGSWSKVDFDYLQGVATVPVALAYALVEEQPVDSIPTQDNNTNSTPIIESEKESSPLDFVGVGLFILAIGAIIVFMLRKRN